MKQVKTLLCLIVLALCTACGNSPESKGEQIAELYNKGFEQLVKDIRNVKTKFAQDFDQKSYKTRIEARDDFNVAMNKVLEEYETALAKAKAAQDEAETNFAKNEEELEHFRSTLKSKLNENDDVKAKEEACINSTISKQISTITPPEPSVEKIKKDLCGHTICDPKNGYSGGSFTWNIKDGEIQDLSIEKKESKGENINYELLVVLKADGGACEVECSVSYILASDIIKESDYDWSIDFVKTKSLKPVKTGTYDSCYELEKDNYGFHIRNTCDKALLIGGRYLYWDEWRKFQKTISGNKETYIYCDDCKIDFAEIPY